MPAYLITGNAGSGKSTVLTELQKRGYLVIEADDSQYSHWVNRKTGESYTSRPAEPVDWIGTYDWLWKTDSIKLAIHNAKDKNLFIVGASHNIAEFYPLFKKIFLLKIDTKTLTYRLTHRVNNPFGKRPGDLERVLEWHELSEQKVLDAGGIPIDATNTTEEITDQIIGNIKP